MVTVGQTLKNARESRGLKLEDVEEKTKIKKEFLNAIEKEDWNDLPEFPVVSGFVKNIASSVGVDTQKATALLRRDYPPKEIPLNPKKPPEIRQKFSWSPKLTFLTGTLSIALLVGGYLLVQYKEFSSPPELELYTPLEGIAVKKETRVSGKTDPDTTVIVNNQPVILNEEGRFEVDIKLGEAQEIVVKAVSRSGKETILKRNVVLDNT